MSCTRREVLYGIGAGSLLVACGGGDNAAVDAQQMDAPACPSGDLCLDTSTTQYKALANANGNVLVNASVGQLIVVRQSATAAVSLSSVCTHQGCTVNYSATSQHLVCPCHGATFTLTGSVVSGPTSVPLKSYPTTIASNLIEIKLA